VTAPSPESDSASLGRTAELDRRLFELESLLKAGEVLQGVLDINELCDLVLSMISERTLVADLTVFLLDEEAQTFRLEANTGRVLPPELMFPADRGILWSRLRAGQPFSVVDLEGGHRFADFFVAHGLGQLASELWLPLVMSEQVVGVVTLGKTTSEGPLADRELSFVGRLVKTAAVSLNTALLYRRIDDGRSQLKGSLHKLSLLFDITRALSAVSDLTQLLRIILERSLEAAGAERGSMMLLDEASGELVIKVVFGLPDAETERKINEGLIECQRFGRGEGIAGRVLQDSRPIRVDNVGEDRSFERGTSAHVRSLICVPLHVDDETIGVINISNKSDGSPFSDEDEEILSALADQAAVAIARARLYEAAITDGLTGLHVRRFTLHRLRQEVKRALRYGPGLSVIMADIDHFKEVNDTHGHLAGDRVLEAVAEELRAGLRQDVDIAGRYGGEEFLIVVPQTDLGGARDCAERLRSAVESRAVDIGTGSSLRVTMSFGVAQLAPEESDQDLIGRADSALYEAKEIGRNRVVTSQLPTPRYTDST
jgi:diguanylate cyclase (GGDEF)-like protein